MIHDRQHILDQARQVMGMANVVDQDAGMRVEGRGAFRKHAGALRGQRIKGIRLGRDLAFADGEAPVEAAEGYADAPGEQRR